MAKSFWRIALIAILLGGLFAFNLSGSVLAASCASTVSLTGAIAHAQDFNTLANTGTSSAMPTGWCFVESGANANTTYTAGTGSSNTGETYSFGSTGNIDRALGGLLSGNLNPIFGAGFVNNTGSTITGFQINYRGEEWRLGTAGRTDQLDFQYSLDATSLTAGTWVDFNALDFVTPDTATTGAKNGDVTNTTLNQTITGLTIANGAEFSIRWTDFNASGADDGLAVDAFFITPILAAPDTTPPTVTTFNPVDNATNVAINSNLVITFDENVQLINGGTITIRRVSDNSVFETFTIPSGQVTVGTTAVTINPTTDLANGTDYYVEIAAATIEDIAGNDFAGFSGNTTWNFTTIAADTTPPTVTTLNPLDNATGVPITSNLVITFNENVQLINSGTITIRRLSDDSVFETFPIPSGQVSVSGAAVTIDPTSNFANNTAYYVEIAAATIEDTAGNDFAGFSGNTTWNFTTAALVRIRDIQGTAHISPMLGQGVTGIQGVVTAKRNNGFYIQDPDLSGDTTGVASSEGIFVFTGTTGAGATIRDARTIGETVLVSGTVVEFRPGFAGSPGICQFTAYPPAGANCTGAGIGLSVTEIVNNAGIQPLAVTAWSCSGTCTITSTIIGTSGRIPPSLVLNSQSGDPEALGAAAFDPTTDGIDFYESIEGMLVTLNAGARVVSPSGSFSSGTEVWVVGDNFANSNNTPNPRGGLTITPADYYNPERIRLTTKSATPYPMGAAIPNLNVGSTFDTAINGIIDYSFHNYEMISLSSSYTTTASTITKEITPLVSSGTQQLTIATFNVENLGGNAGAAAFATRANVIVNNLRSPDIIILEEMQDNNGATNDAVVAAATTFNNLISAITTASGPTYAFQQIDPTDDADGGEPGGNIRVGFLYRTDRGITFVPRTAGNATSNTTITCTAGVPTPNFNPGRIDPTNTAFNSSRKPTVGEFTFNGETFFIIGSHWNSKGGDDPVFGIQTPPDEDSRTQRDQQATIVRNFVNSILACNPNANVIVGGDLNDYQFSPPVNTLLGTTPALTAMNTTLPENERYSYVYNGTSQSLDHLAVSPNLLSRWGAQYDSVHVNSEFYDQISDHDPSLILLTFNTVTVVAPTTTTPNTTAPQINVFDPAISKLGFLLPGQLGVTGEKLEWVVTVSNTGNAAGNNVVITDTLRTELRIDSVNAPGGTVNISGQTVSVTYATLQPGQTFTFSIFTTVAKGITVDNIACVKADNLTTSKCTSPAMFVSSLPSTGFTPWWAQWLWVGIGGILLGSSALLGRRWQVRKTK